MSNNFGLSQLSKEKVLRARDIVSPSLTSTILPTGLRVLSNSQTCISLYQLHFFYSYHEVLYLENFVKIKEINIKI
jgi:hypothetical protein